MSALSAEQLTARYPGQPAAAAALLNVNVELEAGERLLLLGPNGAGKSTFIRVFAGLMHATHGKALVAGQPARQARGSIGVVSHTTYLYDELSAAENLRFYATLYGEADPHARAALLLDQVGMAQLSDVPVARLSRGQQQRVTIARALMHDAPVLLLDEPDTGLDVGAFELIAQLLTADSERTVVLTTHNLATGLRIGTRVGVLAGGRLVHERARASSSDAAGLNELLVELSR